jgi:DNA modification methylase
MAVTILKGDCRDVLRTLPDESVHCVVTSPPYWGLRDYGNGASGIGLEETIDKHIDALTALFRDVRRALRPNGTLWLNYGDSYAGSWGAHGRGDKRSEMEIGGRIEGDSRKSLSEQQIIAHPKRKQTGSLVRTGGCKAKDLMGLPWMLAFALRADGWYLRQDIIWSKPNPMPESVRDRCTKAHEYLFLLSKSERYHYDADAIAEAAATGWNGAKFDDERDLTVRPTTGRKPRPAGIQHKQNAVGNNQGGYLGSNDPFEKRNKRSVWEVSTNAYSEAHFATFPPALIEPCILAGCPKGGGRTKGTPNKATIERELIAAREAEARVARRNVRAQAREGRARRVHALVRRHGGDVPAAPDRACAARRGGSQTKRSSRSTRGSRCIARRSSRRIRARRSKRSWSRLLLRTRTARGSASGSRSRSSRALLRRGC